MGSNIKTHANPLYSRGFKLEADTQHNSIMIMHQVDDIVNWLIKDGFINTDAGIPKIRITEEGIEQIRNNQI